MVKKLLTMTMGLLLIIGASAQTAPESVNIAESDVEFWVGTGSNSSLVCIGWDHASAPYTPTVVVWGIHWNGNITLQDALDSVAAYDSRFTYTVSNNYVSNLDYNDPDNNIHLSPYLNWNCNNYNGVYSFTYLTSSWLRISESTCDNYNFTNVNNLIYASDPNATNDPVDASIDFSDILYWVGEGSDSAVLIVNFGIPDTAFAWGYRFNGTATVQQMTDAITAADPRFTVVGLPSMYPEGDIFFVLTSGDTLSLSGRDAENPWNYWEAGINGEVSYTGASQTLVNGDVFKYGDQRAPSRICVEEMDYGGTVYCLHAVWTKAPTPVTVPDTTTLPVEASIAASDILYWVGEGTNKAIMAINWADTALAWGYRFNGTKSVGDMMNDIAAADPRFSYEVGTYGLDDILFVVAEGDTLRKQAYSYWESKNNGVGDMGMGQNLNDGDIEKWAEPAAGIVVDSVYWDDYHYWSYVYVYPMAIHPVSVPDSTPAIPEPEHGPFCGAVGTEGCDAVAADSNSIVAWATGCSLNLGPQNIAVNGSPAVSYGTADDAIGPCTMNDNLSVVSLGDGGSATLTFARPIRNGEGPDFAVYENSFNDSFLELAFVEVSSDGERFVRFPATSLTQTETQATSVDPTYINNLAGKYRTGYGTPFDLEELRDSTGINLDSIVYVRIVDVVGSIDPLYATYDAFGHIVNDPWPTSSYSSGFDLDGVAVMYENTQVQGIDRVVEVLEALWPNPTADRVNVRASHAVTTTLLDRMGRELHSYNLQQGTNSLDLTAIPAGVYFLRADGTTARVIKH